MRAGVNSDRRSGFEAPWLPCPVLRLHLPISMEQGSITSEGGLATPRHAAACPWIMSDRTNGAATLRRGNRTDRPARGRAVRWQRGPVARASTASARLRRRL